MRHTDHNDRDLFRSLNGTFRDSGRNVRQGKFLFVLFLLLAAGCLALCLFLLSDNNFSVDFSDINEVFAYGIFLAGMVLFIELAITGTVYNDMSYEFDGSSIRVMTRRGKVLYDVPIDNILSAVSRFDIRTGINSWEIRTRTYSFSVIMYDSILKELDAQRRDRGNLR